MGENERFLAKEYKKIRHDFKELNDLLEYEKPFENQLSNLKTQKTRFISRINNLKEELDRLEFEYSKKFQTGIKYTLVIILGLLVAFLFTVLILSNYMIGAWFLPTLIAVIPIPFMITFNEKMLIKEKLKEIKSFNLQDIDIEIEKIEKILNELKKEEDRLKTNIKDEEDLVQEALKNQDNEHYKIKNFTLEDKVLVKKRRK